MIPDESLLHRLDALTQCTMALTNRVATAAPWTRLVDLLPEVQRVSRAASRLEVLAAMYPELTLVSVLPAHALSDQDNDDFAAVTEELKQAAALPLGPIKVIIRARDESIEHASATADLLQSMCTVVEAIPRGGEYWLADITQTVLNYAVRHDYDADDDLPLPSADMYDPFAREENE